MPRIEQIEAIIVDLPTIRQHVLSMATMTAQTTLLVQVTDTDGVTGWGEATAIGGLSYGEESVDGMKLAVDTYIAPLLIDQNAERIAQAMLRLETHVQGNPSAKCAIEMALHDLNARRLAVPISQRFGGRVRDRLECAWTLASGVAERDIDEAQEMLERRRHRLFKIKIGKRTVGEDVAHVAEIKRAIGDRGSVRVDVNQAWSPTTAKRGLAMLEDVGCDLVEQPVHRRRVTALARLSGQHGIAVMADECLRGPEDALKLAGAEAVDAISVKLAPSGGLAAAATVAAIAHAAGIGVYGGTMIETGIGTAAAAQLFATLPKLEWGTELFGPLLFTDELLVEPLDYFDFALAVPDGPGLGVELDPDKLAYLRRDRTRTMGAVQQPAFGGA